MTEVAKFYQEFVSGFRGSATVEERDNRSISSGCSFCKDVILQKFWKIFCGFPSNVMFYYMCAILKLGFVKILINDLGHTFMLVP